MFSSFLRNHCFRKLKRQAIEIVFQQLKSETAKNQYRNITRGIMVNPKQAGSNVKIGTHDGVFHCDEILACYLLKRLPQYKDAEIIRTRDQEVLDTCDVVVDVGGEFDASRHRYDHHQRTFNETMNSLSPDKPWKIKLSSAGLVYCHFGMEVLKTFVGKEDEDLLNNTFNQVYELLIQEIDGIDNGVPMFAGEPCYRITTNLSARVSHFNSQWNSKEVDETAQFYKAFKLVGDEFEDRVNYVANVWWPARHLVLKALENRKAVHESGEIVELTSSCPWKEHLLALEKQINIEPIIKFLLYTDNVGVWRIQAVPIEAGSFKSRIPLLKEWQGLRGDKLSEISGIDGCVFVHATGFIGANKTREGVLEMAIKCLAARDVNEVTK